MSLSGCVKGVGRLKRSYYQSLTKAGLRLKTEWMASVSFHCRLQELQQELTDVTADEELLALRHEQQRLLTALDKLRAEVRSLIERTESLNSLERRVLRLRYLYADPWDAIASQVGREPSAVYTAHRKALNKVADTLAVSVFDKAG